MNDKTTAYLVATAIVMGLSGCSKDKPVTYADVEPTLQERCAECHTGDHKGVVKSGFSVESYETVMKGTKLGAVIVPNSAASSTLYRLVAGKADPSIQMPHGEEPLSEEQIETIRIWIDQGAVK